MNNVTRKKISKLIENIEKVVFDAKEKLEEYKDEIDSLRDEEQEKLDNMQEKFEGTERYEIMEQAVDNLDNAASSIEELIDALDCEELIEYLNDAAE